MKHFKTISEYCKGINIDPPKHLHFDIRNFEENMKTVHHKMAPFRHEFYAIAIKAGGDGKAATGRFADLPEGASIFFNTPFQVLSWDITPNWQGYYLMFSQDFIAQSSVLFSILQLFSYLKIDKSTPLAIPQDHLSDILRIFAAIWKEYHSTESDKFKIIEAEIYLLLTLINRFFESELDLQASETDIKTSDLKLLSQYRTMIQASFHPNEKLETGSNLHSTKYYAQKLNIHPNHLNARIKSISGLTALNHVHDHILALAKSYLAQTDWTVKEIAYTLHFESPNNFSSFFKRKTQRTALEYREEVNL